MPESKTERLLQVVLCLSQGRRYVTKDQLREVIPDYAACPTTDAFERMFERDKDELRELGVPLETGGTGHRRRRPRLPDRPRGVRAPAAAPDQRTR